MSPPSIPVTIIVLAAGRSSRMGGHKLLMSLAGRPLLTYAVGLADRSAAAEVVVVLGYDADRVREALPAGRERVVICPDYATGMSASLRAGIQSVDPDNLGAVTLLADQPLMTDEHLTAILWTAAAAPNRIVATRAAGRVSTPVYFPQALFGELRAITGDEGGRSIIARHRDLLVPVDAAADEVLDVDDPDAFRLAQAVLARRGDG